MSTAPFPPANHKASCGFSLIQVSAIIAAAALLMVTMLPQGGDAGKRTEKDLAKLARIEDAMTAFMLANCRRPCPAGGNYLSTDADFGVEAPGAPSGDCITGSPAALLGPDAGTGNIVAGTIPTRSLNLPETYAFDEYGRRFTYVVDKRATSTTDCRNLTRATTPPKGGIHIRNASALITDQTMYAYISHGRDGHGAFPIQGSTVAGRFNSGSTDTDTLRNASVDSTFVYNTTNFTNIKSKKEQTSTFDDLVYYRDDLKNTCLVGYRCFSSGFRADGTTANDNSGRALASGDINGDGIQDVIVGAWKANGGRGYTYVVFGTKTNFPNPLPLSSLTGSNGFRLDGVTAGDYAGKIVGTGDINGDGIDDVLIGAESASSDRGYVYVVFGKRTGWAATTTLSTGGGNLIDGTQGFRLNGVVVGDLAGSSLAAARFNSDQYADLVIGARGANASAGYAYLVFGKASGWAATIPLNTGAGNLIDGTQGFRLDGITAGDGLAGAVASGDINNDGYDDLLIGASAADSQKGYTYVVFGKSGAWSASTAVNTGAGNLIDGTQGFRLDGVSVSDTSGRAVAAADVNGDALADVITTAPKANSNRGYVYIVFGKASTWSATATLSTGGGNLIDGTQGFRLDGVTAGDLAGMSIAAGDTNSDARADMIIGASGTSYAYVVFGTAASWPTSTKLSTGAGKLIDGVQAFRLDGATATGYAVAACDLNDDGKADVIAGAPSANSDAGYTYTYFGRTLALSATFDLGGL